MIANEIRAAGQVGFKKKIQRLMGTDKMSAVSTDSSLGEKFFLFSMLTNGGTKLEVQLKLFLSEQ